MENYFIIFIIDGWSFEDLKIISWLLNSNAQIVNFTDLLEMYGIKYDNQLVK